MTEEKKNGDLVPMDESSKKTALQLVFEEADNRIAIMNELRVKCLKVTKAKDWIKQGTKPYLLSDPAARIADFFQFEYTNGHWEEVEIIKHKEGPDERVYKVVYDCKIPGLGKQPVMGAASTRHDLFSKRKGSRLELHDMNIPNVQKTAFTNCMGNGPRHRVIGNIDWHELEAATGIKENDVKTEVEYMGGSGKKQDLSDAGKSALQEIKDLLNYCFLGVAKDESDWLHRETTFEIPDPTNENPDNKKRIAGKRDPNKLTEKQIPHILAKLKRIKNDMVKAEANPPGAKS
jgi:hypothetical protein